MQAPTGALSGDTGSVNMVRVSTAQASIFFAVLSLACWVAVVGVGALVIVDRARPGSAPARLLDDVSRSALWLAWAVALVATLGSLYYSEVAHFVPCRLCWYQRIAMYPLSFTLLVGALHNDRRVWLYAVPQAAVGAAFAAYHTKLQAFPQAGSPFCTTTEPCTVRYVWELGFVSLPFMALAAFAFVITMTLVARTHAPLPLRANTP